MGDISKVTTDNNMNNYDNIKQQLKQDDDERRAQSDRYIRKVQNLGLETMRKMN